MFPCKSCVKAQLLSVFSETKMTIFILYAEHYIALVAIFDETM